MICRVSITNAVAPRAAMRRWRVIERHLAFSWERLAEDMDMMRRDGLDLQDKELSFGVFDQGNYEVGFPRSCVVAEWSHWRCWCGSGGGGGSGGSHGRVLKLSGMSVLGEL